MENFNYTFLAVRGIQNGRDFYQATVPFRALASMLKLDDCLDVNERSQRIINKPRARKVAEYISSNQDGFYVIPPLVGFIDGDFSFDEITIEGEMSFVGKMQVPMERKIVLFDGQHRAYGIRELMKMNQENAHQMVSIMFFNEMSLAQRQQAFHDINFTQKTPAAALCIAYNGRSEFDSMIVDVFSESILRAHIEYEKNSVSGDNPHIYSLKAVKDFTVNLIGKNSTNESKAFLADTVHTLFDTIKILNHVEQCEDIKQFRRDSILGHAVTLKALALFSKTMLHQYSVDWTTKFGRLKRPAYFDRTSEVWLNRCVDINGKMISNQNAVMLTFIQMLKDVKCPFPPELQAIEDNFNQQFLEKSDEIKVAV
ncbi:DNA sulfur modification protein DndB [uncultured Shewanella sp.]|uniref:DNA sulfur modification protein DndB n=1 Tax=uncultured Shewanella sp. TaxID=173975 RepID=UPI00263166B6|nr:DNA sulfur modification protein DndB [uncultured Shewanella sp.]